MANEGADGSVNEETPRDIEDVVTATVDAAFHLHRGLGPGLLESVYQKVLARMLEQRGLRVERNKQGSIRRVVNPHERFAASRLRVSQSVPPPLTSTSLIAPNQQQRNSS